MGPHAAGKGGGLAPARAIPRRILRRDTEKPRTNVGQRRRSVRAAAERAGPRVLAPPCPHDRAATDSQPGAPNDGSPGVRPRWRHRPARGERRGADDHRDVRISACGRRAGPNRARRRGVRAGVSVAATLHRARRAAAAALPHRVLHGRAPRQRGPHARRGDPHRSSRRTSVRLTRPVRASHPGGAVGTSRSRATACTRAWTS